MTASVLPPEPGQEARQLDQTLVLLSDRLQRVLTALALTLDARRAVAERLALVPGHVPGAGVDVALFELSAARCREIVKSLATA